MVRQISYWGFLFIYFFLIQPILQSHIFHWWCLQ